MSKLHNQCLNCRYFFDGTACPMCNPSKIPSTTTDRAVAWLYKVADTLKEKGRMYGNSIDDPVRIFSKAGKSDGLAIRIDDKLARIRASETDDNEDSEMDLVGYIALKNGTRES